MAKCRTPTSTPLPKPCGRGSLEQRSIPTSVDAFFNLTRQFVLEGNRARALKTESTGSGALSRSAGGEISLEGISWLVKEDQARAVASLKKAAAPKSSSERALRARVGLNNIAYQLAGVGMVEEAMVILQTAIEMYPKEANLYDSLGEFQLKKGEKAKALASYQKALEVLIQLSATPPSLRRIVQKLRRELAASPAGNRKESPKVQCPSPVSYTTRALAFDFEHRIF